MRCRFIFFITLLIFTSLSAQGKFLIIGHAKDASTKLPISNANVYLVNTMSGSVTDSSGYFRIQLSRPGNYEIVVSILGYETINKMVELSDELTITMDFSLVPKVYEMGNIGVTASVPEEWNNNYRLFKSLLLGKTEFAKDCTIENKEVIDFNWKSSDVLIAKALKPLVIINKALGFKIDCILTSFEWNKKEFSVYYIIKPRFTLLNSDLESEKEKWNENRITAYERSVECFLSSLINNDYWKKGYSIYWDYSPALVSSNVPEKISSPEELISRKDLQNEYVMSFSGYLKVINGEDISWLKLLYPEVTLNKAGFSREVLPYKTYGYWSTLGMANLLPLDYKVEENAD